MTLFPGYQRYSLPVRMRVRGVGQIGDAHCYEAAPKLVATLAAFSADDVTVNPG